MYFREDSQTAAELLKQAVPQMVKRKIPTNPCNFALWYAYAADRDKNLKAALDSSFPVENNYAPEKSEELFFDYFVKAYMPNHEEAQEAVVSLLTNLFQSTQKTAEGTRDYGASLQKGLQTIKNTSNPGEVEAALMTLMQDTEAVDKLTQEFSREINSAKQEIESLKQQLKESESSAFVDSLTKIGNRREFDRTLAAALAQSKTPTSLLLLDLDHFKRCNDTYGHLTGDRILAGVGQLLATVRTQEVRVARYGGEEFAVIVSGQSADQVRDLAESIRQKVTKISIKQKEQCIQNISASIGVAHHQEGEDRESLIGRADQALYQAKQQGRNQVQVSV